jgi:hypothetical protein
MYRVLLQARITVVGVCGRGYEWWGEVRCLACKISLAQYARSSQPVHMDSQIQDSTVSSSTSPQHVHQIQTTINPTAELQVQEISSTTSSDVEAILQSLVGFD